MSSSIRKAGLPIIILVVAAVGFVVLGSMRQAPEKKPVEQPVLLVEAEAFTATDVVFTVATQGNVVPKNQTVLTPQVSGRIVAISPVFVEGGFFEQGDVLLELESADFETDVKLAEAELARSQAALEEEIARGRVAEQEWRSVNNTVPPELGLRKPQLSREQANVKAAQAQLERAKRNLARTKITAPYAGMVVARNADIGQFVSAQTNLGEIYSTDVAEVRLPLTDSDLAFVNLDGGRTLPVELSAVVAGKPSAWQGEVVRSEGVLDQRSRVVYAVVEVNDPYLRNGQRNGLPLRFGQFVNAAISGKQADNIIVLPRHTLRLDGSVLAVTPEREIAIRNVEVVRADEEFVYISSGLQPTDKVAVSAVPNPYDGMPVRLSSDPVEPEPTKSEQDVEDSDDEIAKQGDA
ncbi:efflux RND transporter periplasmic adaptor subunit [Alteromonas sp. ASW11-36]|uniref:Efflux RND transporter periplasmic adaptor subunit n=1 Tax=Alteromonas arenosi TaxID=3055817 RepID=A0ABT7SY26_9ALTE|nr:efflux RND transporter periplasmic adaptor subunit [Alteromonas sp. ASW11-36]MDM7860914.1 efflux RND transporter periplasmic adaptor subunit [Alteromonas sp. ASW11-36]